MTAPNNYAVTVYLNDTDITAHCPYDKMSFDDYRRAVSNFSLTIENPTTTPVLDDEIWVFRTTASGTTIFVGNIVTCNESKRDNGITKEYEVEAADRKIRLQKAIVPYVELDGSDTDILQDLLDNVYPDLDGLFDFSSGVNSFANDLSLNLNDDTLLDALDKLADKAGADYSFSKGSSVTLTFGSSGFGPQNAYGSAARGWYLDESVWLLNGSSPVISALGNPGSCAKWTNDAVSAAAAQYAGVYIKFGGLRTITNIEFDYYIDGISSNIELQAFPFDSSIPITITPGTWQNHSISGSSASLEAFIGFVTTAVIDGTTVALDLRIDNVKVTTTLPYHPPTDDQLNWDNEAPLTDFNFDIQAGDEFGFDIDNDLGGWDNYNSITVIGGHEKTPIDWTYPASGYQDHLALETHIKDIAVSINSGSDATPSWTALSLGKWGVDELTSDGGTKDVLYDELEHWLYFETEPAYLRRSIRVTGSILKPIRVRVENYAEGETVYATTVYNSDISTPEQAAALGFNELEKRNAIQFLRFRTYEPGLQVGQAISVTDSARGLSATAVIQTIRTKWLGSSGHAEFEVECGEDENADAGVLIANNDKRSREKAEPVPVATSTVSALTDDSGVVMTDDSGVVMYEIV